MYTHVLRCCVLITEKACTKFALRAAQKLEVAKCASSRCTPGYLLLKQSFCTDGDDDSSEKSPASPKQAAEDSLARLLEDPEKCKLKKLLELEIDVLRHSGARAPQHVRPRDWVILLSLPTKSQRRRHIEFVWRNEMKKENQKEKKSDIIDYSKGKLEVGAMTYGLQYNTLFMRIYLKTMQQFYNSKVISAMIFGPNMVFDLSYESYMSHRENTNCAKQLGFVITENRQHCMPFHLYLCNAIETGPIMEQLYRIIPTIYDSDFPITITPKSYLDLFPKNKLVYLTPHCRTTMQTYDSDNVYIVGGIVDKSNPQPFSLAKAKREGLKMQKFPLDEHLKWGPGSGKNLSLNHCTQILLDLHHSGNWEFALRHVPKRKLCHVKNDSKNQEGKKNMGYRIRKNEKIQRNFQGKFQVRGYNSKQEASSCVDSLETKS